MGNMCVALVQYASSVQAAYNPHNPHAPGPVKNTYLCATKLLPLHKFVIITEVLSVTL